MDQTTISKIEIRKDGKTVYVGSFPSEEVAHGASLGYIKAMGWNKIFFNKE